MGVNIGNVIVEAHDIFGDGVNVAANAHGLIGLAKYFLGRGEETEAHIHEAQVDAVFCASRRSHKQETVRRMVRGR